MPPQQPTDRLAAVRQLAATGSLQALGRHLYRENAAHRGDWTLDGGALVRLLQELPVERRVALLRRTSEGLAETAVHAPPECRGLATLNVLLAQGLSAQQLAPWREPLMAEAAGRLVVWEGWRLTALLEADLAAGRELPADVLATARRTALIATVPGGLAAVVGRFTGPVLNPGEPWADRALADLAGTPDDTDLRALLGHALTATGAKPTAKWLRAGRPLVDAVGPHRLRAAVAQWFALVGQPRRQALAAFQHSGPALYDPDPYNWHALQGLAALLTLTPPHPEAAEALGALAEAALIRIRGFGPRSPRTAAAAVRALTALGGPDARAELERLAPVVAAGPLAYKPTAKAVAAALTGWGA
ncbi:hypothetical protein Kpho02_02020 [Kitasatospora phosalacinea]|uniref:Uncharacterized protein n=1 Tax=Kitasatospora phosalacinea TaxID=2065 RepID=A0A9W6Q3K8_9ACTN|nr:hypothetical protein [Kitasatospora phosalacinea]GLW67903.1 hypothetical protein Kpho02_02020 [Kitasatospora phosalacinea]